MISAVEALSKKSKKIEAKPRGRPTWLLSSALKSPRRRQLSQQALTVKRFSSRWWLWFSLESSAIRPCVERRERRGSKNNVFDHVGTRPITGRSHDGRQTPLSPHADGGVLINRSE